MCACDMTRTECVRDFGQLFMMAIDGPRLPSDVAEYFATFRIGGVILFSDNYEDPGQLRQLTGELQKKCANPGRPLLIATDHEGGSVQRFVTGFTAVPPMASLGAQSPEATRSVHSAAARELRNCGINFNLAPVADLSAPGEEGAIGDRSFGLDPERVSEHVVAAITGITSEGLLCCAKHFPGHGATPVDSRQELPSVHLSKDDMEPGLQPFRAAIRAGVPSIMTAHIIYPNAGDAESPASMSEYWVSSVLRRELGYTGVVITDALEMKSLRSRWTPEYCGFRALAAGVDILLYYKEAHQHRAFDELRRALEKGEVDARRIAGSLQRVRHAKQMLVKGLART
jgi:beta-N-acetylhexosaminidase